MLDKVVEILLAHETVDGSEIYTLAGRAQPEGPIRVDVAPDRRRLDRDSKAKAVATTDRSSPAGQTCSEGWRLARTSM